jgi:DNA invertase Pin-like site-specific DNA recombinase
MPPLSATVACVIYAAKSTEDLRGSLPDQLQECRTAIESGGTRHIHAEYADEAVSAFSQDRGQGLADAMQHVEDLAQEFGTAELWAQHSDRLARGDGKSARHVVEIGLWALKRDITVRTVQDPDTFRDLLYAVVTGQRNHEDSRRKSLAVAAGHRRAVERGGHIGPRPDGYRVVVEVDEAGAITKRLDFDPERQPMIQLMFRLALRRTRTGAIARALNDAGWQTKPNRRGSQPRSWTCEGIHAVLTNPRYAGLSTLKGEIIAQGHWPPYITAREHQRIRTRLSQRRQPQRYRPLEIYLFTRLAHCGRCGSSMQQHTGRKRKDGTFSRRYACASHVRDHSADACDAPRIDADMVEAMFVAAMPVLFADDTSPAVPTKLVDDSTPDERQQVINAVLARDDSAIDAALEQLLARMNPEAAVARQLATGSRDTRRLEAVKEFAAWASDDKAERTDVSRREAARLNGVLRNWLTKVVIAIDADRLSITVERKPSALHSAKRLSVSFERGQWHGFSPVALRPQPHVHWERADIIGAMQRWKHAHGHAPQTRDWELGSFDHPAAPTVRRHFRSWAHALRAAGLKPANPQSVRVWQDHEIIRAIQAWTVRYGQPPKGTDWMRGTPRRPCKTTVYNHFGNWTRALGAASQPSNNKPRLSPS